MKKSEKGIAVLAAVIALSCYEMKAQENNGQRQRREPPSVDQIFEHLDTNEDGKLSKKEVRGPLSRDFDRVDLNEDGFISREELEKAPKPERGERPNHN